ncbi:hypothetical protein ACFZAM_32055 [Streptomyces sp. NPDC008079]|uniref:hypothetical protein n=1 Tax=Streptomyces sp. NPDC008079 TaxID=3364806 RepID=UPI0036E45BA8
MTHHQNRTATALLLLNEAWRSQDSLLEGASPAQVAEFRDLCVLMAVKAGGRVGDAGFNSGWPEYLMQREVYRGPAGQVHIVADLHLSERVDAAAFLRSHADWIATQVQLASLLTDLAPEIVCDGLLMRDADAWLQVTPLYEALMDISPAAEKVSAATEGNR